MRTLFAPVLDRVKGMFDKVQGAVQPVTDVFSDYIGSGEAAVDATNLVKDAIDLAAGMVSGLLDGVSGIAQGFAGYVYLGTTECRDSNYFRCSYGRINHCSIGI